MEELAIFVMEIVGTIAFAISGAMLGIQKKMDVFGVTVLGIMTAVGGGMIRDIILNHMPVALTKPTYVIIAAISSLITFVIVYLNVKKENEKIKTVYEKVLLLMDAAGLGVFTVVGVMNGLHSGYIDNTFLLVFLGTVTGVGGGLLRDMMAGIPPYIFFKHIYVCASLCGAFAYVLIYRMLDQTIAMVICCGIVFLIRMLAARYRWNLPRI